MGNPVQHAAQTTCSHGHQLTEENVVLRPNRHHGGVSRHCRSCLRVWTRERNWRKMGITPEAVEAAFIAQEGRCAICRGEFVVWDPEVAGRQLGIPIPDHDHETGVFRGLLCQGCNLALGHLGDDAEALRRAADYIDASRREA